MHLKQMHWSDARLSPNIKVQLAAWLLVAICHSSGDCDYDHDHDHDHDPRPRRNLVRRGAKVKRD